MAKKKADKKHKLGFIKRLMHLFPRHKALPNQASFIRRFYAFSVDTFIITMIALTVFGVTSEIEAKARGEKGAFSKAINSIKGAGTFLITTDSKEEVENRLLEISREMLKEKLPPEEYETAKKMSLKMMEAEYSKELRLDTIKENIIWVGEWINILREIVIGYIYFIFFFRFGGRSPGKRLFRLKVVDLKGKSRLGWYQAFERAHGYAASALVGSIGFLQVLWDKEGLAMHDKIAGTTVIKLAKKEKPRRRLPEKKLAKDEDS